MGRRNISQLRDPIEGNDITYSSDRLFSNFRFETGEDARAEDKTRRRAIRRIAKWPKADRHGLQKRKLRSLVGNIKARCSTASSVYMRKHRRRIINALHDLSGDRAGDLVMINLLPQGFTFRAGQLNQADARKLLARFQQLLLRHGSADKSGWLIAFLDGEFEPNSEEYVLHIHGLATSDYLDVLQSIRSKSTLFRKRVRSGPSRKIRARIRNIKGLTNLPSVAGYCIKSFWCERYRGENGEGVEIKEKRKRRISEPFHTEYLLWMDRYEIQDLSLLVGLEVDKDGRLNQTR